MTMSDDEYVAIQKLTHPITGATVYLPEGQAQPDSKTTLEQDGLVTCQYDEHGKYVSALVHDPHNIRGELDLLVDALGVVIPDPSFKCH